MANDQPTSMGMRFGALQHHASGVTEFKAPRNGYAMNYSLECAKAQRRIEELVKHDVALTQILLDVTAEVRNHCEPDAAVVLHFLYVRRPELAPADYWKDTPDWLLPEAVKKARLAENSN